MGDTMPSASNEGKRRLRKGLVITVPSLPGELGKSRLCWKRTDARSGKISDLGVSSASDEGTGGGGGIESMIVSAGGVICEDPTSRVKPVV